MKGQAVGAWQAGYDVGWQFLYTGAHLHGEVMMADKGSQEQVVGAVEGIGLPKGWHYTKLQELRTGSCPIIRSIGLLLIKVLYEGKIIGAYIAYECGGGVGAIGLHVVAVVVVDYVGGADYFLGVVGGEAEEHEILGAVLMGDATYVVVLEQLAAYEAAPEEVGEAVLYGEQASLTTRAAEGLTALAGEGGEVFYVAVGHYVGLGLLLEGDEGLEVVGLHPVIAIHEGKPLSLSLFDEAVADHGHSAVLLVDYTDARVALGVLVAYLAGGIETAVVYQDTLPVGVGLLEDAVEAAAQVGLYVVDGNQNRDGWGVPLGRSARRRVLFLHIWLSFTVALCSSPPCRVS